jgi:phosphoglycolate phosphatase
MNPAGGPAKGAVKGVVFDLDGTLADTRSDIAQAMNFVLRRAGLPTHPPDAYRRFVGDGVDPMVERASRGGTGHDLEELKLAFRQRYRAHLVDETVAYAGVEALLLTLCERGVPLAVLSNKPQSMTAAIVAHLFEQVPFEAVLGQRADVPKKPDPTALLEILEILGLQAGQCAMVGDTAADMGCAVASEVLPVGVSWGFRGRTELRGAGAVHVLEQPSELLALVSADRVGR